MVEVVSPVTVIVKSVVLLDPGARFPDCRSLESHTKVSTLREYCCGWLRVSVIEADSDPELKTGIMAQIALLAYGVPDRDWHGSGNAVAEPSTGFDVPE
jgi:hypothetical protein